MWADIYNFLSKGGILMIPILAGSVIALAFFIERLVSLRRKQIIPSRFVERVKVLVRQNKTNTALVLCEETDASVARVMEAAFTYAGPREGLREHVQEKGRHEAARLDRFVEVLGVIASIEPLLGLLGTVKGMIEVFHNVSRKATEAGVDVGLLANGIWEALITTAFGLAIAIPVFVAYKYIISKTDHLVLDMEESATEVVELMERAEEKRKRGGSPKGSPHDFEEKSIETTSGRLKQRSEGEVGEESKAAPDKVGKKDKEDKENKGEKEGRVDKEDKEAGKGDNR